MNLASMGSALAFRKRPLAAGAGVINLFTQWIPFTGKKDSMSSAPRIEVINRCAVIGIAVALSLSVATFARPLVLSRTPQSQSRPAENKNKPVIGDDKESKTESQIEGKSVKGPGKVRGEDASLLEELRQMRQR